MIELTNRPLTVFMICPKHRQMCCIPPSLTFCGGRGALHSSLFISQSQILCSENGWGSSVVPLPMPSCTQNSKEMKQL